MKTFDLSVSPWLRENGWTREAGLQVWENFLPQVSRYAGRRNFVDPEHSSVSTLSPWMNKGLLSEQEITAETLARYSFSTVEKFLQEVYWRRYWRGYLTSRPQLWSRYRAELEELQEKDDLVSRLRAIEHGECEVEIMGYFARQLVETGYMHNHARMWFAAWWVHEEKLPWQLGADFFMRHLIDGDPAANTLSWR